MLYYCNKLSFINNNKKCLFILIVYNRGQNASSEQKHGYHVLKVNIQE